VVLCFITLGLVRGGFLLREPDQTLELGDAHSSSMARPRSQASASFGAARDGTYTELEEAVGAPAATAAA
jgi:hypothetical protein